MRSMTGFGSSRGRLGGLELEIIIRSVNSRFLDLRMHLPKEYLEFEPALKKNLVKKLKRGSVDVFVHRRQLQGGSTAKVELNAAVLKQWQKVLNQAARVTGGGKSIDPVALVQLPEVVRLNESHGPSRQEQTQLNKCFTQALDKLVKARGREGSELKTELSRLVRELSVWTEKLSKSSAEAREMLRQRLMDKWKNLSAEFNTDSQRVGQELIFYLDRSDITEELTRLKTHLDQFRVLLGKQAEGKKLDFYTQELLREVNTIGSKAGQAEMTASVVECKSLIEKIREQVQNIE